MTLHLLFSDFCEQNEVIAVQGRYRGIGIAVDEDGLQCQRGSKRIFCERVESA